MPVTIPDRAPPERPEPKTAPLWRRLVWFATLYAVGVGAVGLVAYGLRLWIKP